jgi:hypothetical protein
LLWKIRDGRRKPPPNNDRVLANQGDRLLLGETSPLHSKPASSGRPGSMSVNAWLQQVPIRSWNLFPDSGVYTAQTMPNKMGLVRFFLLIALLGALGTAALVSLFPATEHLSQADLQRHLPIKQPFHVLISCEVHKQSGQAVYGNDAPIFALFAGCKPQGNFYLVGAPSTP